MSYTLQRAVNDGQVTYNVAVDSTTEVKECKIPVPQNFPVDLLIHVRVFAIGEITEHSFTARFDLYVNWPEQMEGAVEFAQDLDEATLAGVSGDRAALANHAIGFIGCSVLLLQRALYDERGPSKLQARRALFSALGPR